MGSSITRRRLLKYGTVGAASLGFGLNSAWRASADGSGFDQLSDHVEPCFNQSPVGPAFAQSLVIPPALAPSAQTTSADVYGISELRGQTQFIPGITTPIWGYNGGLINERQWDPLRVDAFPVLNTTEQWTLVNDSGEWGHSVHIHLGRFRIVGIEGRQPRPGESGFKDTVWVGPDQTIRVVHQFWDFTGRYVFHCHNGSHEDADMMSQFEVVPG